MTGGRLSIKPPEPLPPPTAEQVLTRLSGDVPPIPRALAKGSEPHDWRWFIGGLGRVLISLGLLIFAFVGYQLWGTGIQYRQSQGDLKREFEQRLAEVQAVSGSTTIALPDTLPSSTEVPEPPSTEAAAPTTTIPSIAVAPDLPQIELGNSIAFLEIPKVNLFAMIAAGVRTEDLKDGVGHFPETPMPGQPGNAALAGHRTTFGAPFGNLDRLESGDRISVTTLQGHYEYVVFGSSIVSPSEYSVVSNSPDQKLLTLITCHPKYTARQRLVVTAVLDEAASDPLGVPTINYGRDADELASGADGLADGEEPSATNGADAGIDTSVAAPESSIAPEVANSETTDGSGAVVTDDAPPATDLAVDAGVTSDGESDASADAFAAGWFSDKEAWPQVAMWGLACTAVSLLAWLLGRKTRNWFSALVGIAPFVVVLYFFFENVNRLLPPNL